MAEVPSPYYLEQAPRTLAETVIAADEDLSSLVIGILGKGGIADVEGFAKSHVGKIRDVLQQYVIAPMGNIRYQREDGWVAKSTELFSGGTISYSIRKNGSSQEMSVDVSDKKGFYGKIRLEGVSLKAGELILNPQTKGTVEVTRVVHNTWERGIERVRRDSVEMIIAQACVQTSDSRQTLETTGIGQPIANRESHFELHSKIIEG